MDPLIYNTILSKVNILMTNDNISSQRMNNINKTFAIILSSNDFIKMILDAAKEKVNAINILYILLQSFDDLNKLFSNSSTIILQPDDYKYISYGVINYILIKVNVDTIYIEELDNNYEALWSIVLFDKKILLILQNKCYKCF